MRAYPHTAAPETILPDAQLVERAKRKKSDHQTVTHQPSAGKVCEMLARFTAPDEFEAKCPQPIGRDDAMIFRSGFCLITEITLNLSKPAKIVPWRKDSRDRLNP